MAIVCVGTTDATPSAHSVLRHDQLRLRLIPQALSLESGPAVGALCPKSVICHKERQSPIKSFAKNEEKQ